MSQSISDTVTVTPAAGASRLPLSSTARHRIVWVSEWPAREVPPVSIQLGRFASASRMRSRSISASNSGASSPTMRALRMAS